VPTNTIADPSPAGSFGIEPTVVVPPGAPPNQLETADLITGIGPPAVDENDLIVEYVLATYSSGQVVESSWNSQPLSVILGAGQVIPGWNEGLIGMQVGGRRELIVPPSLAIGSEPPEVGIASDDTLVFIVDLLSINGDIGNSGSTGGAGAGNSGDTGSTGNTGDSSNTGNS
jgi:peptidylprolyl isomerase